MDMFERLARRKIAVARSDFPKLAKRLVEQLRLLRKQWLFHAMSALKAEDEVLDRVNPVLGDVSSMDAALKAFQLNSVISFASKQGYFPLQDHIEFERQLKSAISPLDLDTNVEYTERYLNCAGDIECLSDALADHVIQLLGGSILSPDVRLMFKAAAVPLAILSQATTASIFGDHRTEKRLKSLLRLT